MAKVVLIVDDDAAVLETAVMLVESLGYRAEAAHNATEALRIVTAERLDAVFTDVVMPGMNGFQLAKRIRSLKPSLPVICVTGYAGFVEDREYCDILLKKPYDTATLAGVLAKVCPGEMRA
jgi:CheY-like chemotaxis protein